MGFTLDEVKKAGRFAYLEPAEGHEHCVYAPGEGFVWIAPPYFKTITEGHIRKYWPDLVWYHLEDCDCDSCGGAKMPEL